MPKKARNKGEKRKLAIVTSGGGMRCAYGAGALLAIAEHYKLAEPDILIAASGSAGNSAYYMSGQYSVAATIWISALSGAKFISYRRQKIVDIDFLIDDVFRKQHPFDIAGMKSKKTLWLLPVTRVEDGETVYLEPPRSTEVYEYLRAAKAIPVIYGKSVTLGETEYVDGDFGANTDDFVREAIARGGTDIIVIESNPLVEKQKMHRATTDGIWMKGKIMREKGMMNAALRELNAVRPVEPPKGTNIITIAPSRPLPLTIVSRSAANLRDAFNLGYDDVVNNQELAKLFA